MHNFPVARNDTYTCTRESIELGNFMYTYARGRSVGRVQCISEKLAFRSRRKFLRETMNSRAFVYRYKGGEFSLHARTKYIESTGG